MNRCIDFALHNIVRVRLLNGSPRDEAVVRRQLGSLNAPVCGEADITIRFVEMFPRDPALRYLGDAEFAYGVDAFYVLRGKHKSQVMVQFPMDAIGGPLEITCGTGVPAVPYLIDLINLTALVKGFLPLHASAIRHAGRDVLVTGWAKGGKTESLLGFAEQGARYIGDEWVYLSPDNQEMVGIPEPIRLWDWHLRGLPRIWGRLRRSERIRLDILRSAEAISGALGHRSSLMRRIAGLIHRQRYVQVAPERLFDDKRCERGCPDHMFLVISHAASDYSVRPIAADRVAEQMQFSMLDEFSDVLACYRRYRFAFPERVCALLEQLPELLSERLRSVLDRIPASMLLHPYPVCPRALFQLMVSSGAQERSRGFGMNDEAVAEEESRNALTEQQVVAG